MRAYFFAGRHATRANYLWLDGLFTKTIINVCVYTNMRTQTRDMTMTKVLNA